MGRGHKALSVNHLSFVGNRPVRLGRACRRSLPWEDRYTFSLLIWQTSVLVVRESKLYATTVATGKSEGVRGGLGG